MKLLFAAAGIIMEIAAACADATPAPTATPASQVATVTPRPIREWSFEGIVVDGDTVTVSLYLYAGIDVNVTLDGAPPSRVDVVTMPILEFIFENVAGGEHPIVISDVVGWEERASVIVKAPNPDDETLPGWLAEWVADLEAGKVEFPPKSITRLRDQGETVYYVIPQCWDFFTDLLDADGNLIGHPGGGITGRGDGVTPVSRDLDDGELIWPAR